MNIKKIMRNPISLLLALIYVFILGFTAFLIFGMWIDDFSYTGIEAVQATYKHLMLEGGVANFWIVSIGILILGVISFSLASTIPEELAKLLKVQIEKHYLALLTVTVAIMEIIAVLFIYIKTMTL